MKKINQIQKSVLKRTIPIVVLALGLNGFFYSLNNYYSNFNNEIKKNIQHEIHGQINGMDFESKINESMYEAINYQILKNQDVFKNSFKENLDSILDDYIKKNIQENIYLVNKPYR